jgi:hypothetical protein
LIDETAFLEKLCEAEDATERTWGSDESGASIVEVRKDAIHGRTLLKPLNALTGYRFQPIWHETMFSNKNS